MELELNENELVVARSELDALHDELYVLACAVDDVERDLGRNFAQGFEQGLEQGPEGQRAPTAQELTDALTWLLEAARPLRDREIGAV